MMKNRSLCWSHVHAESDNDPHVQIYTNIYTNHKFTRALIWRSADVLSQSGLTMASSGVCFSYRLRRKSGFANVEATFCSSLGYKSLSGCPASEGKSEVRVNKNCITGQVKLPSWSKKLGVHTRGKVLGHPETFLFFSVRSNKLNSLLSAIFSA